MRINGLECTIDEPNNYTATIVMCNGFNGSKDTAHRINRAKEFVKNGFRVLRWDYRSITSKQPTKTLTEDLNDTLSLIDWLGDDVGLFGESWGGQLVLQAGARNEKVKAVVARVPITDLDYFKRRSPQRDESLCAQNFYEDILQYNTYEDVLKRKIPILIFSGTRDVSSPLEYHQKLFQLLPEPKKHIVFDEPHGWPSGPSYENTTEESLKWFKKWL